MFLDDSGGSERALPEVDTDTRFSFKNISKDAVLRAISRLKSKRSFGHDGISGYILKIATPVVSKGLTKIFNVLISSGTFPA